MTSNSDDTGEDFCISDEDRANVDSLVSKYPELEELRDGFYQLFPDHDRFLSEMFQEHGVGKPFFEHDILLFGLTLRSKKLLEATLGEIDKENKPAVSVLLRAQCETLATACYLEKFPAKLRTLLLGSKKKGVKYETTNIMTQLVHANKRYPGLKDDYEQLSEMAHPSSLSHFSQVQVLDDKTRSVGFSSEGYFSKDDAVMSARLIQAWTKWFLGTARLLHQHFSDGVPPMGMES